MFVWLIDCLYFPMWILSIFQTFNIPLKFAKIKSTLGFIDNEKAKSIWEEQNKKEPSKQNVSSQEKNKKEPFKLDYRDVYNLVSWFFIFVNNSSINSLLYSKEKKQLSEEESKIIKHIFGTYETKDEVKLKRFIIKPLQTNKLNNQFLNRLLCVFLFI